MLKEDYNLKKKLLLCHYLIWTIRVLNPNLIMKRIIFLKSYFQEPNL